MASGVEATTVRAPVDNRRKPWAALILSWFAPGLGHLYAGDSNGALIALSLALASLTLWPLLILKYAGPFPALAVWLAPVVRFVIIPVYAWYSARRARRPYALKPFNQWYWYLAAWMGWVTLGGALIHPLLKDHVVEAFRIPSGSMEPAVLVGDFIYVDKRPSVRTGIERGTIVTFMSIEDSGLQALKRVVGVPGDTLAMEQGELFLNGDVFTEPYAMHTDETKSEEALQRTKMKRWQVEYLAVPASQEYLPDLNDWGPLVVPTSAYFLLGDNREASYDSRYFGFIPEENIVGRPRVVYWSFDPHSYVPLPFLFAIRWSRIGQTLN